MNSFDFLWQLLAPKVEYANRKRACYNLWMSFTDEQRLTIFNAIKDKKTNGQFVDYNPYFAIQKNSLQQPARQQTLSYADYYARFGTTEEQGGWHMANPTGQKVIFVKSSGYCREMVP